MTIKECYYAGLTIKECISKTGLSYNHVRANYTRISVYEFELKGNSISKIKNIEKALFDRIKDKPIVMSSTLDELIFEYVHFKI